MPKKSSFLLKIKQKNNKKTKKNNNFCSNFHAKGEILDIDPLSSLHLTCNNKKQSGRGFCFSRNFMEKADISCIFPRLCGKIESIFKLDKFSCLYRKWINFNLESIANILLLAILILEMAMPHKIFAIDFSGFNDGTGAKYQFSELALASDVYSFNDKYVPEEIELQRLAVERVKSQIKVATVKSVTTTAYSSTVDQCDDTPFIAASGKRVHDGMVAANFLPFNTKIKIPDIFGDKIFIVEDRMNRRFQNRVDIWMETRQEAMQYGVRQVKIEILE